MNKFLFALLTVSSIGFADRSGPMLQKASAVVFAPVSARQSKVCKIFHNRVETTLTQAGVSTTHIFGTNLPSDVYELIGKAKAAELAGNIIEQEGPMDIPTTTYTGFLIKPADGAEPVTLLQGGGYFSIGFMTFKNTSKEAEELVDLIDTLCK